MIRFLDVHNVKRIVQNDMPENGKSQWKQRHGFVYEQFIAYSGYRLFPDRLLGGNILTERLRTHEVTRCPVRP